MIRHEITQTPLTPLDLGKDNPTYIAVSILSFGNS
jgi:hypothetical protein